MKRAGKSLADKLFPIEPTSEEREVVDIPPEKRRLHTETYDFSIATLVNHLKDGSIFVPTFQRNYVWNRGQASRLIESLIIQCPIPVIYLNQELDETLSVIDGNQRLTSIKLFVDDDFELQGLSAYPELEGNKFSDLDPRFRRHILNRTLRCITILKETHPQIKFDVFERINTGAVQLNPQEVRHGVYHGPLMTFIDELSQEKIWKKLTGRQYDNRMKGTELVLRYLALTYNLEKYKKPLKTFLNEFCSTHHDIGENDALRWKSGFLNSVEAINYLYEGKSFRVLDEDLNPVSKSINSALFDAVMVSFTQLSITKKTVEKVNKVDFLKKFQALTQEEKFYTSITAGTSATGLVKYRINEMKEFLKAELK